MSATCKKQLLLSSSEFTEQIVDLPVWNSLQVLISEKEYLELKCEVGYWQRMHKKALLREGQLKNTIKKQAGKIRDLTNRVFGKKSEKKSPAKNEGGVKLTVPKRPRGQQPGSKGHGRTTRPDLKHVDEPIKFKNIPKCSKCGAVYIHDEDKRSEILEVDVKAYKRVIIRSCVKKDCSCKGVPNNITTSMPPKLIPKSPYGNSIWESVLLNKFHYSQPTNRLINQYAELGLPISAGSIAGGLKILKDLFKPLYEALYSWQMTENRFHNDESGWKVFEKIEGKIGNRWWLWITRSASVVYFQITPGRGTNVPLEHFKNIAQEKIIIICDRYSVYKSLARQLPFVILAFCWAHVRRDFLDAARKYPDLEEWAQCWVEKIGELYHINKQRCKEFDPKHPLQRQSALFKKHNKKLLGKMNIMAGERDSFIDALKPGDPDFNVLTEVKYKVLTSLLNHWEGLNVFVEHPEVPMDNNNGERPIRNPVTGRKNFYGSASLWSSQLAAMMFSIFQTMVLWNINCDHWLKSYLAACAENHGKPPEDLSPFLPWKMDKERQEQLAKPFDTS